MKPAETIEIIAEDQIAPDTIQNLFRRAFFSTSLDDDGYVRVEVDQIVLVSISADNKLLKFIALYRFHNTASLETKLALVNKMNEDVIVCRFSVPEDSPDILVADYFLSFEGGILAFQIVRALRLFSGVVPRAIRDCDVHDIVQ